MTRTTRRIAVALVTGGALAVVGFGVSGASSTQASYTSCMNSGGKAHGLVSKPLGNLPTTVKALRNLPANAYTHTVCGVETVGL